MKRTFFILSILLMMVGSFYSCGEKETTENVATGTVIGTYSNGFGSLLVQVDRKFPIGKTLEYSSGIPEICTHLPNSGNYQNMIQVQPRLPLSDFPEGETIINKRISFSYRAYRYNNEEDLALFTIGTGIGNALCTHPDVPMCIITSCQIIK